VVGYSHRPQTRQKARNLAVASEIADDLAQSVAVADMVILATPIFTFENIFAEISPALAAGCIVTDVGSAKVLPHRWAARKLSKSVFYVGSHPIAGSEQRGVEFARDDLFDNADCIVTKTRNTNPGAIETVKNFWQRLGCFVQLMSPAQHDKVFAGVSHLPHIAAVALTNAADADHLRFAGKGFLDTSRVASGPANIWADILLANAANCQSAAEKLIGELKKIRDTLMAQDRKRLQKLLEKANTKRNVLVKYKIEKKGLIP